MTRHTPVLTLLLVITSQLIYTNSQSLKVGILIPWNDGWPIGPRMGSGGAVGLQEVQDRGLLPGYTFEWQWKDSLCQARDGFTAAVELWKDMDEVDVFIGGGCSSVCEPVALLAAAYNVPFVSFGCTSDLLSNKYTFPTFSRAVGTWVSLAPMFQKAVSHLGWQQVAVITTTDSIMQLTANAIKGAMLDADISVTYYSISSVMEGDDVNQDAYDAMKDVIRHIQSEARIVILCMYDNDIMNYLLASEEFGMVNGDYVYFGLDIDGSNAALHPTAYDGFISANVKVPSGSEWDSFANEVITEFSDAKFNGFDHTNDASEVDVHAGLLHDAILMWATAVKATVEGGGDKNDGVAITNNIFNSEIEGITGTLSIDGYGDRKPDYNLEIINNNKFVPIFSYSASTNALTDVGVDDVTWQAGTAAPPDGVPTCAGTNCLAIKPMYIIIIVVVLVVLITIVSIALIYRSRRKDENLS